MYNHVIARTSRAWLADDFCNAAFRCISELRLSRWCLKSWRHFCGSLAVSLVIEEGHSQFFIEMI